MNKFQFYFCQFSYKTGHFFQLTGFYFIVFNATHDANFLSAIYPNTTRKYEDKISSTKQNMTPPPMPTNICYNQTQFALNDGVQVCQSFILQM